MKRSKFILPLFYIVFTFLLLVIPGKNLPTNGFFSIKSLDKIVHTVMFLVLTLLFCRPLLHSGLAKSQCTKWFSRIALYAFFYGIIMEIVQKYFVPFRAFEVADIAADGLGCLFGFAVSYALLVRTKRA